MTMRVWMIGALGAVALSACDPQATPDYTGQVLLSLSGSVEIESTRERGELLPALAYYNSDTSRIHIQEVEVEGRFPSDFTLRVYMPPPAEAMVAARDRPLSAMAYLTAVTEDHPDTIPVAHTGFQSACAGPTDSDEAPPCPTEQQWCTADASECYLERTICPSYDSPPEDCELLESSGNPALREDAWANFAGLSETYVVIYLAEPLEADHPAALNLGVPGLSAGYHLARAPMPTQAQQAAFEACKQTAANTAATRFNEAHGTSFVADDFLGGCASPRVGFGDEQEPREPACATAVDHLKEFEVLQFEAEAELSCGSEYGITFIDDPENERISVRIGPDVRPWL